jgi:hypothetical protein
MGLSPPFRSLVVSYFGTALSAGEATRQLTELLRSIDLKLVTRQASGRLVHSMSAHYNRLKPGPYAMFSSQLPSHTPHLLFLSEAVARAKLNGSQVGSESRMKNDQEKKIELDISILLFTKQVLSREEWTGRKRLQVPHIPRSDCLQLSLTTRGQRTLKLSISLEEPMFGNFIGSPSPRHPVSEVMIMPTPHTLLSCFVGRAKSRRVVRCFGPGGLLRYIEYINDYPFRQIVHHQWGRACERNDLDNRAFLRKSTVSDAHLGGFAWRQWAATLHTYCILFYCVKNK